MQEDVWTKDIHYMREKVGEIELLIGTNRAACWASVVERSMQQVQHRCSDIVVRKDDLLQRVGIEVNRRLGSATPWRAPSSSHNPGQQPAQRGARHGSAQAPPSLHLNLGSSGRLERLTLPLGGERHQEMSGRGKTAPQKPLEGSGARNRSRQSRKEQRTLQSEVRHRKDEIRHFTAIAV
ncbi:hypothetical protein NDU88_006223 [Pleurodeles waltl]|uniref:Uncharacterized protein n=1 Tax=Pleurodeles waltl TaxID=8319 RepID=A0AAV7NPN2_PLEWA|nr:hypothetical protein NDU88_006223 [Pleurodeles waltl]